MTFIKLDPNLMQGLIKNLESYADEAERARSDIHSSSVNNSHPVPEVDDATYLPAIFTVTSADAPTSRMMDTLNSMSINSNTGSSYNTTMGATINALGEVIDGLQERLQVIIDLNTDGISTTSSDGVPGYYLPDGTADTVENVKAYNTEAVAIARADADALTQATASSNGTAEDGRTVDEILDSLTINQDNPVYGAAVVTEAGGAQAYLDLLYSVNDYYENDYKGKCPEDHFQVASQVLGYVLAAVSQWEGGTLADDLYETIDSQNGAPGNMAAINMLLSAPAAHYGTDFLTNLADKLEDRDPDALVPAYQVFANNKTSTSDPMDGVLTAMGNNPDAALEYLTPEGGGSIDENGVWVPGQTTVDRWTMLTSRDWGEDASGLDALTAVTGAASSFRNRAPSETDPDVPATADARATYTSGMGVDYFSGDSWSRDEFTDTMKHNLAVVAANSSQDVATAAARRSLGAGATSSGLAVTDIASLIYRFGDHQDAMTTLATGLGQYHHNAIQEAMNGPDASKGSLRKTYQRVAASSSYLQTLLEFRFADDKKKGSEEQKTTVDTSLSVLNVVSAAGLTALTDEAAAFTAGSTIAKPLVSSQVTDALGTSTDRPADSDSYMDLRAQSYAAGLNYGLFSTDSDKGGQRAIDAARGHSWYHEDENGNPAIDTTALTGDQALDAAAWKEEVRNDDDLNTLNDLDTSITTGKDLGKENAESNNGPRRT